jgi:hypothetical protein
MSVSQFNNLGLSRRNKAKKHTVTKTCTIHVNEIDYKDLLSRIHGWITLFFLSPLFGHTHA